MTTKFQVKIEVEKPKFRTPINELFVQITHNGYQWEVISLGLEELKILHEEIGKFIGNHNYCPKCNNLIPNLGSYCAVCKEKFELVLKD